MFKPEVLTRIGGSHCVVRLNSTHYIEAKKWFVGAEREFTAIYVVKDGKCYLSFNAHNVCAPETIVDLMREYAKHGSCGIDTSNKLAA